MVCRLAEPEGFATVLRSPTAPPPSFFLRPLLPQENGPPESILAWAVRSHSPCYLEALQAHGVEVATSCQQGVCGTCQTRVLAGEPDHWDMYLTPDEQAANDCFMPCISRSKSAVLVLDL